MPREKEKYNINKQTFNGLPPAAQTVDECEQEIMQTQKVVTEVILVCAPPGNASNSQNILLLFLPTCQRKSMSCVGRIET